MAKLNRNESFLEQSRGCAEVAQKILIQLSKKLEVATAFTDQEDLKDILTSFRDDLTDAEIGIKNAINYAIMAKGANGE
jgi:hypothetical protein